MESNLQPVQKLIQDFDPITFSLPNFHDRAVVKITHFTHLGRKVVKKYTVWQQVDCYWLFFKTLLRKLKGQFQLRLYRNHHLGSVLCYTFIQKIQVIPSSPHIWDWLGSLISWCYFFLGADLILVTLFQLIWNHNKMILIFKSCFHCQEHCFIPLFSSLAQVIILSLYSGYHSCSWPIPTIQYIV